MINVVWTYINVPINSVLNPGSRAITDARNVSITVYHSLIQMPDNDFKPVYDDPRVGYFTTNVTDMTAAKNANYRDLVHKWNLVKKDPSAALSEPVEPIVWWMEKTTPENLRPIIKSGAEQWNIAFEKAGFKTVFANEVSPCVGSPEKWQYCSLKFLFFHLDQLIYASLEKGIFKLNEISNPVRIQ